MFESITNRNNMGNWLVVGREQDKGLSDLEVSRAVNCVHNVYYYTWVIQEKQIKKLITLMHFFEVPYTHKCVVGSSS